ncbi:acyl-CoA N-acyltransferase [Aspergillus homomorphus CBS 101889]|uniref:Acyl-CoA N-acyltransferase n=1 Tax=Aspergillus homomorphus (strain CBS 101889) TaxID=1450537 RepID=A0A395HYL9_ASPHC|nr:acyl-CoA N-acyltransferase [Aspergillus homomorphus CBS 101889]RAL11344.1 acyl-CoA N-acyltransferase [Aspergillus homomorphus CBS 101889]
MVKPVEYAGLSGLKAFVRPLALSDLDSCVEVESAFPEQERCSREKFIYRLTVCPDLCLGLFVEKTPGQPQLIGHVIATRVSTNRVLDASMEMPENWTGGREVVRDQDGQVVGNDSNGRFVGVHSLAIRDEYQRKGLGRALMDEYIAYARDSFDSAQSIVIIAHDHLIKFYTSFGFENLGPSPCAFGGGGWYDMELSL